MKKLNEIREIIVQLTDDIDKTRKYADFIQELWFESDYIQCRQLCKEAIDFAEINDDTRGKADFHRFLGNLDYIEADYCSSLDHYLQSLQMSELLNDKILMANAQNNIGSVYNALKETDKALAFFILSKDTRIEAHDEIHLHHTLSNIAGIYSTKALEKDGDEKRELQEKSLDHYLQAYELMKAGHEPIIRGLSILNNIGNIYLEMEEYDSAFLFFERAKDNAEKAGNEKSLFHALLGIGEYHEALADFPQALFFFQQAEACAERIHAKDKLKDAYQGISRLLHKMGQHEEAYLTHLKYSEISKEVFSDQMQNRIAELQSKFDIQTKENELEIYRLKNIELVNANREIEKQKEELERLNASKNDFLGIVVHDLRNPMTCVLGLCDLMQYKFQSEVIDKDYLLKNIELIKTFTMRMNLMVHQLLDLSAIESGRIAVHLKDEDLVSIFKEREFYYKKLAEMKNIRFILHTPDEEISVFVDRMRILDVLDNLITNALKFTDKGGEVQVTTDQKTDNIIIHIADTGQGLFPDEVSNLFHHYKKLSSKPTGGETSTGYGLLIVKKILDLHNSTIEVQSQKNIGTTFSFSLPLAR